MSQFGIKSILSAAVRAGASDIYFQSGYPIIIRKNGKLTSFLVNHFPVISDSKIYEECKNILSPLQIKSLKIDRSVDVGYEISDVGRFRLNVAASRSGVVVTARLISQKELNFESLYLPKIIEKISGLNRGLVLVTGKAGAGKSTTMASMVKYIDQNWSKHILTLEDPIEFSYPRGKGVITQKELGADIRSFKEGLRAALRQDPDVIVVGEMRDQETINMALLAAETGHLVISTLHTMDATEAIHRIVSSFPSEQQNQIRYQLASNLQAVVCQRLLPTKNNEDMVPAVEVLINNTRIKKLIMSPEKTHEIQQAIEQSHLTYGMQTFDQSLMQLIENEKITFETAMAHASRPADFELRIKGILSPEDKDMDAVHLDAVRKKKIAENVAKREKNNNVSTGEKPRGTRSVAEVTITDIKDNEIVLSRTVKAQLPEMPEPPEEIVEESMMDRPTEIALFDLPIQGCNNEEKKSTAPEQPSDLAKESAEIESIDSKKKCKISNKSWYEKWVDEFLSIVGY